MKYGTRMTSGQKFILEEDAVISMRLFQKVHRNAYHEKNYELFQNLLC